MAQDVRPPLTHQGSLAMRGVPVAEIHDWLYQRALPLWGTLGIDRRDGGYVEQLDFHAADAGVTFKRTRVTCRQIYVFSHAAVLGWQPGLALAEHGMAFLAKTWMGPELGWPRTVSREGDPRDATPDLYDLAFVLFALGWYIRASGDDHAAKLARETLDFIELRMRAPGEEGFWHELPPVGWRQQNPHMHLLEAMLACYEATGEDRYGALAIELAGLFERRFFDPGTRTLAEYFNNDWSRAPEMDGRTIEPGHQFEWAWILANLSRLLGIETGPLIRDLVGFAEKFGVDPISGATYNQVRDDGAVINRGSRVWPNTERIKGHLAMGMMFGLDPAIEVAQSARLLLDRYLNVERPGLWIDFFDQSGAPRSQTAPTSTLYHVFLAFSEILRVDAEPLQGPR